MDLDEIQSVQSRERQTDSLQQLRDSFYEEAGQFVRALREERERAAARADDPFDAPEVNRLSDDIATAEQTLEAIYERRVGKIVKMASLAAADMPTEDGGLTTEEQDLFERLVGSIEDNRDRVFDVLEGTATDVGLDPEAGRSPDQSGADTVDQVSTASQADTDGRQSPSQEASAPNERSDSDVPAADLMGGNDTLEGDEASSGETGDRSPPEPRAENPSNELDQPDGPVGGPEGTTTAETDRDTDTEPPSDASAADREVPPNGPAATVETRGDGGTTTQPLPNDSEGVEQSQPGSQRVDRTTVRITDDVGEILGVDDRTYDLVADDVITLPATNATPLLEQGVAERME